MHTHTNTYIYTQTHTHSVTCANSEGIVTIQLPPIRGPSATAKGWWCWWWSCTGQHASIGPMMTSRADVMQMGVVIGQAAENVYLCLCVCELGQGKSMQRPLGFSAASQGFGCTHTVCVCTGRGNDWGREVKVWGEEQGAKEKRKKKRYVQPFSSGNGRKRQKEGVKKPHRLHSHASSGRCSELNANTRMLTCPQWPC